ncbi:MAG TPA: glycosyltransferase family 2 protein [Candidatus Binatia bacterium]|jgi:glycosyltransferase involved in cell wall biosynthesis|nr:glycosyltransferase family 2 protein [Candidatus Binatia bacterium]
MSLTVSTIKSEKRQSSFREIEEGRERRDPRPFVSVVVPAFNEAAIIERNLPELCRYMESLQDRYRWELVLVNDGSADDTGKLAEAFGQNKPNVRVLHHDCNRGLGQAFQTAFDHCHGDYVVTLDLDLSYAPAHIEQLLNKIRRTKAKVVTASPYMKGGVISSVPWLRRTLSIWANRFLSFAARGNLSTLTSMVRVYDRQFIASLPLRSMGMDINPEIIYKAMLLHANVDEIPAHLDWHLQNAERATRKSSMKVVRHTMAVLLSGFLFRPVMFFLVPGFGLLCLSVYVNAWMFAHFFNYYQELSQYTWPLARASAAVAAAYQVAPHTFIVGGMTLMLAIQLISLGILALQNKSYFEEIFHLGASVYKATQANKGEEDE